MRILIWDTETTGLVPGVNEPITVAAKIIDGETFQEVARFPNRLMKILRPEHWGEKAEQVHGYSLEHVMAHGEDPRVVVLELFNWAAMNTLPNEKLLLAGHNVQFDIAMLKAVVKDWNIQQIVPNFSWEKMFDYHALDTFVLFYFMKVLVRREEKYARLVNATKHYGIPHDAHNAEGDVDACHAVLLKLVAEFGADLTKSIPNVAPIVGDGKLDAAPANDRLIQVDLPAV